MYRTWLIPYLEGTLDADRRTELEERLADDPALVVQMQALVPVLTRLHQSAAPSGPPDGLPCTLWPRLQARLAQTKPRSAHPHKAVWTAAIVTAVLLLTANAVNRQALRHTHWKEAQWRRELRYAPRVIFYRENTAGARVAAKLEAQAQRVARERQAAQDNPPQFLLPSPVQQFAAGLTFPRTVMYNSRLRGREFRNSIDIS